MGWVGFNCSLPHKVAVCQYLDRLAPSASLIGAVNCVIRREGHLIGENTDGQGFLRSLRTITDPVGKTIVLLGAGGAARAIAIEAALAGAASILIVNRDAEKGKNLVLQLREKTSARAEYVAWRKDYVIPRDDDILINATSVGLAPKPDQTLDINISSIFITCE